MSYLFTFLALSRWSSELNISVLKYKTTSNNPNLLKSVVKLWLLLSLICLEKKNSIDEDALVAQL